MIYLHAMRFQCRHRIHQFRKQVTNSNEDYKDYEDEK